MKYKTLHEFFQNCSTAVNSLKVYTENNPELTELLNGMQENFLYTVGNSNAGIKVRREMHMIDRKLAKLGRLVQRCDLPKESSADAGNQTLVRSKHPQEKAVKLIKEIRVHINNIKIAK